MGPAYERAFATAPAGRQRTGPDPTPGCGAPVAAAVVVAAFSLSAAAIGLVHSGEEPASPEADRSA
jgi:hypothetical protein